MSKTILVVDDNPDAREMLSCILAKEGFLVITAEDGEAALQLIKKYTLDLIITDIQMPRVDGIELIKRLRDQHKSKQIPILVMSAFGVSTQKAMDAGADRSASKPVAVGNLLRLVSQLLG